MQRIRTLILIAVFLNLAIHSSAQESPGVQLANHIADKMRDTLGLSLPERNQVFAVNMFIHNKKMIIRKITSNQDSLRIKIQKEEWKRDSMYQRILPPKKYEVYLKKKATILTSN